MKRLTSILFVLFVQEFIYAQEYSLKGKLICNKEVCKLTPHCGTFAFAKAFKFEIISTSYVTKSKYIVAIVGCPKLKGNNFFKDGSTYMLTLIPKSTASFSWAIINDYEKEKLPTLWVSSIAQSLD